MHRPGGEDTPLRSVPIAPWSSLQAVLWTAMEGQMGVLPVLTRLKGLVAWAAPVVRTTLVRLRTSNWPLYLHWEESVHLEA